MKNWYWFWFRLIISLKLFMCMDLCRLKDWGSKNLVNFNAVKTQCCLISRRVDRNLPFDSNSLGFSDKMSLLGVTLGSDLCWNDHISTTAKAAACKQRWFESDGRCVHTSQLHSILLYLENLLFNPPTTPFLTIRAFDLIYCNSVSLYHQLHLHLTSGKPQTSENPFSIFLWKQFNSVTKRL